LRRDLGAGNDCRDRGERRGAEKHRQPGEQYLLRIAEQVVAPVDQGVQRLLSRQRRAAACGQQTETFIEAARKLLRRQPFQSPRQPAPAATPSSRGPASSSAGGTPSRRWQIDPTVAALASVRANPPPSALARSTKSRTAAYSRARAAVNVPIASGAGNDGTRTMLSPAIASRSRLDASIDSRGQLRISASATRAASAMTCSQLSRMSKSCLFLSADTSVSIAPLAALRLAPKTSPMMDVTSCGSLSGASSASHTPSG